MPTPLRGDWTKEELDAEVSDIRGTVVPVDIRIEARQKVISFHEMKKILVEARRIALGECECRAKMGRCDGPTDVCLFLDEGADELISKGEGREISLDEAMVVLGKTSEVGLVHLALVEEGTDPVKYVCSCCACCCKIVTAMQRFGYHEAIVFSDMVATQSSDLCDDCLVCVDRCNFGALESVDGKLSFDQGRCFGCGVCVSSCPSAALRLELRVRP
jgi:ferredoxin